MRLIVKELREANELLYFKDQGELDSLNPSIGEKEFVLCFMKWGQEVYLSNQLRTTDPLQVCMDSIRSISQYAGYQLTTLMTVSDLNQVFPVAFLVSSTVNKDIVKAFLVKVKECVGPIKASIFMSNDDPLFRNAWAECMSWAPPVYLNCSWHTDGAFRRGIASKIKAPTSEKAVVYRMARALMDESQEEIFHKECQAFLGYLLEAGFTVFHNYFKKKYLS